MNAKMDPERDRHRDREEDHRWRHWKKDKMVERERQRGRDIPSITEKEVA